MSEKDYILNFLVDESDNVHGLWVSLGVKGRDFIEQAWMSEEEPYTYEQCSHLTVRHRSALPDAEEDAVLTAFWHIVQEFDMKVLPSGTLEVLWFNRDKEE